MVQGPHWVLGVHPSGASVLGERDWCERWERPRLGVELASSWVPHREM